VKALLLLKNNKYWEIFMLKVYKKLISYGKEKQHFLFLTIVFSVLAAFLQVVAFYYLFKFLENIMLLDNMSDAKRYAFAIAGLLAGGGILYLLSLVVSHLFAFRIEANLRKYGIDGLTSASFKFFDVNSSGKIRKLIDDNAAQTHMAVAHLIPDNAGAIITPVLILILGFFISIRVGIVLVVLTLISVILMKLMMGEAQFMKRYQESLEKLSSETVEYVRGMQVVKIFGVDVTNLKALNTAIKEYAQNALNYSLSSKVPYVLFQMMFFAVVAFLIPLILLFTGLGGNLKLLSLELIMVFFLSGVLFTYIMKVMYLSMYIFQAQDAVSKLENLYEEMREDVLEFGNRTEFKNYDIEFNNVSFGYEKDNLILKNLSFNLEENKSYALVGPSGSGKTTIAKLISGFYNVNSGEIKIGGENITSYSKEALIGKIAFVFQDSKLFKTTIYENVALAKKDASREEVLDAMRLAGVDSIVEKFKDRENTLIGSKGIYLSGGEKQRIAIARAILKDARIVIFDEASAAIDPDNEHELQKAFSNLMKEKTVIMIAHRLTTIRNVDEILVFEDGKIIERGSDKGLMARDSVYKRFQETYKTANDWRVANESVI
jgi:ATP-binding cassette subfamily B protein IrtA